MDKNKILAVFNKKCKNTLMETLDIKFIDLGVDFLTAKHKNLEILQVCPDDFLKSSVVGTSVDDLTKDYHAGLEKGMDFLNNYFLRN